MESISIREAAERLGVSHKVIRRLISQGTLEAYKRPGSHGTEWRVEIASLVAYQSGQSTPRHSATSRVRLSAPSPAPGLDDHLEPDYWLADKVFLQEQIHRLTNLLQTALSSGTTSSVDPVAPEPSSDPPLTVTSALQSALLSVRNEGILTLELCSIKVLWGRPVLWRVEVSATEDVNVLVETILADTAEWIPPGEEVVFIWALGVEREVLWGTACGPGWFGAAFEEALRQCRVERR